jgi:hypothetical protein
VSRLRQSACEERLSLSTLRLHSALTGRLVIPSAIAGPLLASRGDAPASASVFGSVRRPGQPGSGLFAGAALALPVASQTTFMPAIKAALEVKGDLRRALIVGSIFVSS